MGYTWVPEPTPARWDSDKARIVGGAPVGVFDARYAACEAGRLVPGDWFRIEQGGAVVGYAWLDTNWGDAEILLATAPEARGKGVGSFALENLAHEARDRGLNYLFNVVRPTHPDSEAVAAWLASRGFTASEDGRLLRVAVPQEQRA